MVKPRKLPMVMRKTAKERSVSFTKRRQGLFSKAANFSMITDSQIALWVTSPCPNGKTYSFTTHHSVNEILDAFLQHRLPQPLNEAANSYAMSLWHDANTLDTNNSVPRNENTESAAQGNLEEFESCNSVQVLKDIVGRLESMKSRLITGMKNRGISQTLPSPSSTILDVCSVQPISLLNHHVGAEIMGAGQSSIAGINYDIMTNSSMPAFGFYQNVGGLNYNVYNNGADNLLPCGLIQEDNVGSSSSSNDNPNVSLGQTQNQEFFHDQCCQITGLKNTDEDEKQVLNDLMDNKWNEVEDGGGVMDSTWIQNLWTDEYDYEKDWKTFEGELMGAVPFEFDEKPISDDWFSLPPLE